MDHYNTSNLHQTTVESDYLGNLQAVQALIKKPGKYQIRKSYLCMFTHIFQQSICF